jgi:hypothetical protein
MCYSSESSFIGGIIGFIVFIILMIRNENYDRTFGIIFGSATLMQITEMNIWKKIENNKDTKINNLPVHITLLIHYISSLIAVKITDKVPKKIKKMCLSVVVFIFILVLIFVMFQKSRNMNITEDITIGPTGHLNWNIDILSFFGIIFILTICGIILLLSYYTKSHYISTFGILLILLISIKNHYKTSEAASMWCYWFNIIGVLLLLKL